MRVSVTYRVEVTGNQPPAAMQAALDGVPTPPSGEPPAYPDAASLWTLLNIALVPDECETLPPALPDEPLWRRVLVFENTIPMSESALKVAVRSLYSGALGQATGSPIRADAPVILPDVVP